VKKKALEVAQKFYEDNKKQVEIGTLAPIEIVRAEARVAQAQQELTNSETALLQQETIIKNALSRTGTASPTVAEARIIPTDRLTVPSTDDPGKLNELIDASLKNRPDIEQTRINLENTKIGISGSKSQLLPSLDVQASFQNNSLSGSLNTVPTPPGQLPIIRNPDPYFLGGYGNALAQIFRRNFPDYSIGFQLNIPIRNRTAQADYIRDQLQLRQQEINAQRQVNDVRVNVQNALTVLTQAKARYQAAVKERVLQEQTLDAENKKYALGASTAFQVVQTQRDLAQAQASEVSALAGYSRARVQLDLQTAQILSKYRVELAEAKAGKSSLPIRQVNN
jgi:outer membrane protein TolC